MHRIDLLEIGKYDCVQLFVVNDGYRRYNHLSQYKGHMLAVGPLGHEQLLGYLLFGLHSLDHFFKSFFI